MAADWGYRERNYTQMPWNPVSYGSFGRGWPATDYRIIVVDYLTIVVDFHIKNETL